MRCAPTSVPGSMPYTPPAEVDTKVFRAPYGAFGEQQWRDAADLIDMNVLWDIDTLDWKRPGAEAIVKMVLDNAHNGAIVLMHDGGGRPARRISRRCRISSTNCANRATSS